MHRNHALLCALAALISIGCQDTAAPRLDARDAATDVSLPDLGAPEDAEPADPDATPDVGPPRDAAPIPETIGRVETSLGSEVTAAGTSTQVTCSVFDSDDQPMDGVATRVEVSPRPGWALNDADNSLFAHTTGEYSVRCLVARSGILDESPVTWRVVPGEIVRTVATAEPLNLVAGERADVSCAAYDVLDNVVDASSIAPVVVGNPGGAEIEERVFRSTRADIFRVTCPSGGADATPTIIEVRPGPPQSIFANAEPFQEVYQAGAVVAIETRATDAFGNILTAPDIRLVAEPDLPPFGPDRFQLNRDGRYTITATLYLDDETSVDTASVTLVVDSGGPDIVCTSPAPNSMLLVDDEVILTGRATDTAEVGFVDVDGIPVPIDVDGTFSSPVNTRPGVNIHTVSATDQFGNTSEVFCPYFAADSYLQEGSTLNDGIILDLRRLAVDDGPPSTPLSSLTDLFRSVVESDQIVATLNEAGRASNPILSSQCVQRFLGGCIFRAGANFRSLELRGARIVSIQLVDGGFSVSARFNNVVLKVDINGTLNTRGDVTVSDLSVSGRFGLRLANGVPTVELDRGSASLVIGAIETDFSGAAGFLVDLLFPLLEDTIRGELGSALEGFIFEEIDDILSSALGGLDLASFGMGFDVPSPNGDPVRVELATSTTTMNANEDRLRIGVGTRAIGPQGHARRSAGVPVFGDTRAIERVGPGTLGAIIHLAMINQLMHTLWRAGFFEIADAGAIAGGAADGFEFSFNLLVPPAIEGTNDDGRIKLHLGPAQALLSYPGIIDEPIGLMVGAVLALEVSLVDGNLSFGGEGGIEFEELHLMIEGVAMEPEAREAIEATFGGLVRNLVDSALGGALPALPVPEIPVPPEFGPGGADEDGLSLGIREPQLILSPARLFLDGVLGQ